METTSQCNDWNHYRKESLNQATSVLSLAVAQLLSTWHRWQSHLIPPDVDFLFGSPDVGDYIDVFGKLLPFLPQRQVRFHRSRHLRENGILSGFPIHSQGVRWGPCLGRQWLTLVACSLTFACFSFRPSTLKTVTTVYKACVKVVFQFFVLNILQVSVFRVIKQLRPITYKTSIKIALIWICQR